MLYKSFGWLLFKIYIYIYIIDNERSIARKSKVRVNIGHSANESTNELWILMERERGQSEELHYCVASNCVYFRWTRSKKRTKKIRIVVEWIRNLVSL